MRTHSKRRILAAGVTILAACGGGSSGREPGPHPDETVFWRILTTENGLSNCGDGPELQSVLQPVGLEVGDHLIFQVASDAQTAKWLSCTTRELTSCTRDVNDPVFEISGSSLVYTRTLTAPIDNGDGCNLRIEETWTLEDRGTSLDGTLRRVHSLVDAPAACHALDQEYRAASPNGLGITGCELSTRLDAVID